MADWTWDRGGGIYGEERPIVLRHFGAGLLNDIADILTVVMGHAEILRDRVTAVGDEALSDSTDEILHAAERGTALVAHYFAFVRNQPEPHRTVELNTLVAELEATIDGKAGPGVRVIFGLRPNPIEVLGDPHQIEQVILNLIANSREAMPWGGEIDIALDVVLLETPRGVRGDMLPPGHYAVIELRDNGAGMSVETRGRLFEPFFSTKGGRHMGLGLHHADHIVRQHGGAILVDPLEPGTRVRVLLPRVIITPAI